MVRLERGPRALVSVKHRPRALVTQNEAPARALVKSEMGDKIILRPSRDDTTAALAGTIYPQRTISHKIRSTRTSRVRKY